MKFQFTHPGRGATGNVSVHTASVAVSIHAPREGCDFNVGKSKSFGKGFNSRTPGGVRRILGQLYGFHIMFQFTHPGRGATATSVRRGAIKAFQFTHPGRGATRAHRTPRRRVEVSIHAPREGCDREEGARYATPAVSIHAPREGCDRPIIGRQTTWRSGFNSRTPGGVRRHLSRVYSSD